METTYFFRDGLPAAGVYSTDGKYFAPRRHTCGRCGGLGGSEAWRHTGWTCFDCGGMGGHTQSDRAYTRAELDKLIAAAAKRAATLAQKRELAEATKRAAARAAFEREFATIEHVVANIRAAAGKLKEEGYTRRIADDVLRAVDSQQMPPAWKVEAALGFVVEALAREEVTSASQFVGAVGRRITLKLTADRVITLGQYEVSWRNVVTTYLLVMHDEQGNIIIYRGGSPFLDAGESGTFKATIADHEAYKGVCQTRVSRAKLVSE